MMNGPWLLFRRFFLSRGSPPQGHSGGFWLVERPTRLKDIPVVIGRNLISEPLLGFTYSSRAAGVGRYWTVWFQKIFRRINPLCIWVRGVKKKRPEIHQGWISAWASTTTREIVWVNNDKNTKPLFCFFEWRCNWLQKPSYIQCLSPFCGLLWSRKSTNVPHMWPNILNIRGSLCYLRLKV